MPLRGSDVYFLEDKDVGRDCTIVLEKPILRRIDNSGRCMPAL